MPQMVLKVLSHKATENTQRKTLVPFGSWWEMSFGSRRATKNTKKNLGVLCALVGYFNPAPAYPQQTNVLYF